MIFLVYLVFLALFGNKLYKNVLWGTAIYLFLNIITSIYFIPGHTESINFIGEMKIGFIDLYVITYLLIAILRFFNLYRLIFSKSYLYLIILLIIISIYLIISIRLNGKGVFIDSKGLYVLIFSTFYFASFRYDLRILKKIFFIFCISIILLFFVVWGKYIGLLPFNQYYEDIVIEGSVNYNRFRYLNAFQGVDLAFISFALMYLIFQGKLHAGYLLLILLSLILSILIQQRVVLITIFAGFISSLFIIENKRYKIAMIFSLGILTIIMFYLVNSSSLLGDVFYQSVVQFLINDPSTSTMGSRYLQAAFLFNRQIENIRSNYLG